MNTVSLELGLLLLGEPPYSAGKASDLLALIGSYEAACSVADLTRLEHLAGAIVSGNAETARDLAARLDSVRSDYGCWLRAALLEACGFFEEAAETLRLLRERTTGEERALVMLASARNLFAAGHPERAWHPLAAACKSSATPRTLRNAARLLAQARKKAEAPFRRRCRIALLSSGTIDFLAPILRAQCFGAGIDAEIYIGPFNQYEQEIRDPNSGLARFRPEVIAIATDWRSLGLGDEEDAPGEIVRARCAQLESLWRECRERLGATVIQFNYEVPPFDALGNLSAALSGGRGRLLRAINLALWEAAAGTPGVTILDVDQIAARFGKDRWNDPVLWHTAKQYPSAEAMPALGHQFTALLRAILGLTSKCLALDLDGVLWGGVIGEDGLAGIQLGGGPAGEAFVDFQRYLQSLTRTGVLLAVCSKNNPEDAVLPFRQHPEMVLRERDIAVFMANWQPKEENLRAIAAAMNIGLDAIVFVDDNPAERSRVRQNLPEVEVVEMPADPAHYVAAVSRLGVFETLAITSEDRQRTASIRENLERKTLEATAGSVDDYLAQLDIHVQLAPFDEANLPRIVQLINKTNQFNMTTRRRADAEVRALLAAGAYTQAMRTRDRFGDSGLTGVLIAVPEGNGLRVDTWLMSCRVLGRRLDEAMFAALVRYAAENRYTHITGEYIPTAKNSQVADLYIRLGCAAASQEGERRLFVWEMGKVFPAPSMIACTDLTQGAGVPV
ncbi:MAG: HAD-IIIC family phosphatase [Bryobacteraceae bacterium]|jgi:FkbH-like protein